MHVYFLMLLEKNTFILKTFGKSFFQGNSKREISDVRCIRFLNYANRFHPEE